MKKDYKDCDLSKKEKRDNRVFWLKIIYGIWKIFKLIKENPEFIEKILELI